MKKFLPFIALIVTLSNYAAGQVICIMCYHQNDSISSGVNNLILNGSFENGCGFGGYFCPNSSNYNCDITNWTCTGGGTSTYANIFSNSSTIIPDGSKAAYFGNWYCQACSSINNDTSCLGDTACSVIGIPAGYPVNSVSYGNNTGVSLQQTVNGLNPGQIYVLEFWAGGEPPGYTGRGLAAVDVGFGDTLFRNNLTLPGSGIGTRFIVEFMAASTSQTIKFTSWGHICSSCAELILDHVRLYTINELSPTVPVCIPPTSFTKICFGDTTEFSIANNPNLFGAQWDFGDPASGVNNYSTFFNPTHYYSAPGTYTVEVYKYFATITDTTTLHVTIHPLPIINLGPDTSFCSGGSCLINTAGVHHAYLWQNGSTNSTYTATFAGTYFVTVEDSGCYATDSIVLNVVPCNAPVVNLFSSDTSFCGSKCVNFFDISTNNPSSWHWLFPGAVTASSTLQNPANICYSSSGSFDVTLIACNGGGCDTLVMSNFINEYAPPTVSITQSSGSLYSSPAFSYQWWSVTTGIINGATGSYFTPSTVGNYYVMITDSMGCSATSNIISVNAVAPSVNLMSSDSSFCEKQCIDFYDLSTNNPTSWQWFFPGADSTSSTLQYPFHICYNNYGSFDVTLIACNAIGCDTLIYYNFINEYPTLTPAITQSNDTLFSSPGFSYQWWNVGTGIIAGATNNYYVPTQGGDYYVMVTDTIGCEGTSNTITITGVNQLSTINCQLSITPNPNDGSFTVSLNTIVLKEFSLHIINTFGQTIKILENDHINQNKINIEMRNVANGLYEVELITNEKVYRQKFVKE